jgi:hypothetical protein
MARVEWSRLPGEETEAVLGIMLCREHYGATRVKPSQGDGGIDIWVPVSNTVEIYQIKGYTGQLTARRKGHIKKSWETLNKYAAANSIVRSGWHLVTPENPTKEHLKWMQ